MSDDDVRPINPAPAEGKPTAEVNAASEGKPTGAIIAPLSSSAARPPYAVIAGYGVPGRALADLLRFNRIPFTVIELNRGTAERCSGQALPIVVGDARNSEILKLAGIERATLAAAMMPDEAMVLQTIEQIRKLNSTARLIARCHYTSAGLQARRAGATDVIVAEQVVAGEVLRIAAGVIGK